MKKARNKRAISTKTPPRIEKVLFFCKRALYHIKKSPISYEKSPISCEKSPISYEKSPISLQKSPISLQKSPTWRERYLRKDVTSPHIDNTRQPPFTSVQTSPISYEKSPIWTALIQVLAKEPFNIWKEPYLSAKEPCLCIQVVTKEPYFTWKMSSFVTWLI